MPNAVGGNGAGAPPMPVTLCRIVTVVKTTNKANKKAKKKFFTGSPPVVQSYMRG
jgi:hypothetical protein